MFRKLKGLFMYAFPQKDQKLLPPVAIDFSAGRANTGIYFDGSIEPATDDDGKPQAGFDVSVACDNPRSFFEDRRATLAGAADFIRDCVASLVVDKFPDK